MTIGALVTYEPSPHHTLQPSPANVMAMLRDTNIAAQEAAYGWLYEQMRRAVGANRYGVDLDEMTCEFVRYVLERPEIDSYIAIHNTAYLIAAMRRHLGIVRHASDEQARWCAHLRRKVLGRLQLHPDVIKVSGNRWALRQPRATLNALPALPAQLRGGTERRMPTVVNARDLDLYIPDVFAYLLSQHQDAATVDEIAKICWDNLLPRPHFLALLGEDEASEAPCAWTRRQIEAQASRVLAQLDRRQAQVALARLRAESQRGAAAALGVTVYAVESRWEALRHAQEAAGISPGQWDDQPEAWRYYGELIMAGLERLSREET